MSVLITTAFLFAGCKDDNSGKTDADFFQLIRARVNGSSLSTALLRENIPVTSSLTVEFSAAMDSSSAKTAIKLSKKGSTDTLPLRFVFENNAFLVTITPVSPLEWNTTYLFDITAAMKGAQEQSFAGVQYEFKTENGTLRLLSAKLNRQSLLSSANIRNIAFDTLQAEFQFSESLAESTFRSFFTISPSVSTQLSLSSDRKTVTISGTAPMDYYRRHSLSVNAALTSENGFSFTGFSKQFVTGLNPSLKKPQISDEELLNLVQRQHFKYFWDYAHPVSGLARERLHSGETVTIGGSGFGLMGIPIGIERGFISRTEGVERLNKVVTFLASADRFHGVWPHWMNGTTGKTIAFSANDDGGDLVETSFMAAGLLTVRQYLNASIESENAVITKINNLLNTIEWNWYTRDGQNVLYWHWSATKGWAMNMQIRGYNEALITYFMPATSSAYSIEPAVYHNGWAANGNIRNGRTFYGIQLPLGYDYGGPLFFAHYSFLGLDPRGLSDTYGNYWTQNVAHSRINYEHSVRNPFNFTGYSANSWGLTASDQPSGYGVHEPTRDNGTISPTAALSSLPYTPEESMRAMRHFYFVLGDKLWGDYGFYDAFNPSEGWWAGSFLAIDQGPILVMTENHRTGLLWNLFMSAPEVQTAMTKLGFTKTN